MYGACRDYCFHSSISSSPVQGSPTIRTAANQAVAKSSWTPIGMAGWAYIQHLENTPQCVADEQSQNGQLVLVDGLSKFISEGLLRIVDMQRIALNAHLTS